MCDQSTLKLAMGEVRELAERDLPFERIEVFIEDVPGLDHEERDVLWLYAWVGADVGTVRRVLDDRLTAA